MARFKRGDRVAIADREVTAADRKSGLYYRHFGGLRGVVDQVYDVEGEVCVEVDQDSLPADILRRHLSIQEQARQKWLNSLSDQERRSLPEEQRQLLMKYTVMVAPEDLAPEGRGKARKPADKPAPSAEARGPEAAAPARPAGAQAAAPPPKPAPAASDSGASPGPAGAARPTSAAAGLRTPPASPRATRPASPAAGGRRLTEDELSAAEQAHLEELLRRASKDGR